MTSILDRLYASQSNRRLFFKDGWGNLPRLRELHRAGNHPGPPRPVEVRWEETVETGTALLRRGAFPSPYTDLPLPAESRTSFFELVLPRKPPGKRRSACILRRPATRGSPAAAGSLPFLSSGKGSAP